MSLRHIVLAGVILLLPCVVANVRACQCRGRQPPCAQYREADAVFVGLVTNIVPPGAPGSAAEGIGYGRISFNLGGDKGRARSRTAISVAGPAGMLYE